MQRRIATLAKILAAMLGLAVLVAAAGLVRAQGTGGVVWVDGVADLWFQNADPTWPANLHIDFYPVPGDPSAPLPLPPCNTSPAPCTFSPSPLLPFETIALVSPFNRLGNLAQYAVIARSNRHTAAVNRTREPITGAAVMYNNVQVAPSIVVPLVTLAYTSPTDVTSIVSIQSTEKNPRLPITATLYSKTYFQILNGTQREYQARKNDAIGLGEPDRWTGGTWLVDLTDPRIATPIAALPSPTPPAGAVPIRQYGSTGWMRIQPATAAPLPPGTPPPTAERQVGAESFLNLRRVNTAVSGFAGVPEDHKARKLFMPLFRADFAGITGFSIVNPGPRELRIKATYYGSPQAPKSDCRNQTFIHYANKAGTIGTIPIQSNENIVLYHLPGDPPPVAPGSVGNPRLPAGCFGSAVVEVVDDGGDPGAGIIAMVNDFSVDAGGIPRTADAYMPTRLVDADGLVAVPVIEHDGTLRAGLPSKHSSLQVMNVDPSVPNAQVTVKIIPATDPEMPPAAPLPPITVTIPQYQAHTFWTGSIPALAGLKDFTGSAVIESDAKLAVVVTVAEFSRDSTAYSGIGLPTATPLPPLP